MDDIRFYEETLVLHPDSSLEEQKALFRDSAKVIESFKGSVHSLNSFGERPIANTGEKKITRGRYFCRLFSASPEAAAELQRKLRINSRVIYFHYEKLKKKETPESRNKRFLEVIENSLQREKERQAKLQQKAARNEASPRQTGDPLRRAPF